MRTRKQLYFRCIAVPQKQSKAVTGHQGMTTALCPLCPAPKEMLCYFKSFLHRKTTLQNLVYESTKPSKYLLLCALHAGADGQRKEEAAGIGFRTSASSKHPADLQQGPQNTCSSINC